MGNSPVPAIGNWFHDGYKEDRTAKRESGNNERDQVIHYRVRHTGDHDEVCKEKYGCGE